MPLQGEYAPSTSKWARDQAETYEATGGREASTLRGKPVIVLTTVGAKSGRLRKTALMRVEHDGESRSSPPRAASPSIRRGTSTSSSSRTSSCRTAT